MSAAAALNAAKYFTLAELSVVASVVSVLAKYAWFTHVVVGPADGDPVPPELHPDIAASIVAPKDTRTIGRLSMFGGQITQRALTTPSVGHSVLSADLAEVFRERTPTPDIDLGEPFGSGWKELLSEL